uniref:KH RNA binding domain containing, signal transduction associated 2 n=2 Tax=Oncorhynchus kisutch TaxID=8019 RepID=A0A8C7MHY3_ONCKI
MDQEKCLPELMAEKDTLDSSFVHAMRLLAEEIEKYEGDELRKDGDVKKYLDVISNKNIKLSERVLIPVQQYPKFNFVGKLLGPRGNSMKRLQEETGAKMSILGKGSMRDKGKEEELRKSGEAKYAHLSNDLHVLIEAFAPPGEAYSRMSHALEEIKKFLVPDYNDEIRQEQLRELSYLNGGSEDTSRGRTVRGRGLRLASTTNTRARGGVAPPPPPVRGAAVPRGTVGKRSVLPQATLTRGVPSPRARGTPGNTGTDPHCYPSHTTHTTTTAMMMDMTVNMMTRVMMPMRRTTAISQRAFLNITNMAMEPMTKPTTTTKRSGLQPVRHSKPQQQGSHEGATENIPMVDIEGATHL